MNNSQKHSLSVQQIISQMCKLCVSQHQLSRMSGVHYNTIHRMCIGKQEPTWETRQKLRSALGMTEERYISISQRNKILISLENNIRLVIYKNRRALRAVHADTDDVFQDLVLCAIRAIDRYDVKNTKASIQTFVMKNVEQHIKHSMQYFRSGGFSGHSAIGLDIGTTVSLDSMLEDGFQFSA